MRIKRTETKLYPFSELNDKAQDNAVNELCDLNVDNEWWEFTYDDAKTACISITEFDIDRGNMIKGRLIDSTDNSIAAILANHGAHCETYITAQIFKQQLDEATCPYCLSGNEEDCLRGCDDQREGIKGEYLETILDDYLAILRKEYEYLTSREAIVESIEANEYEFTEDGKLA